MNNTDVEKASDKLDCLLLELIIQKPFAGSVTHSRSTMHQKTFK